MEGSAVHSLGTARLIAVLLVSVVVVVVCFILGAAVPNASPSKPTTVYPLLQCKGDYGKYWLEGKRCQSTGNMTADIAQQGDTVYVLDTKHERLRLSRWNLVLFSAMEIELGVANASSMNRKDTYFPEVILRVESMIGYSDVGDKKTNKLASSERLEVKIVCPYHENKENADKSVFRCTRTPFFEIDSVYNDYYLVNAKFSARLKRNSQAYLYVRSVKADVTVQSAALTKLFLAIRLIFFPVSIISLVWYILKVRKVHKPDFSFLEKTFIALGASLVFLNLPLEWLILGADIPCMQLIYEIRLVIFYAAVFFFVTQFLYHNMKEMPPKMELQLYKYKTSVYPAYLGIPLFSTVLILYFIIDRASIYADYFRDLQMSDENQKATLAFIVSVGAWCTFYCLIQLPELRYCILHIKAKHQGAVRNALWMTVVITLLVGLVTVMHYIIDNVHWALVKYRTGFQVSGALYTGIYAVWNMYTVSVLILFAPTEYRKADQGPLNVDPVVNSPNEDATPETE